MEPVVKMKILLKWIYNNRGLIFWNVPLAIYITILTFLYYQQQSVIMLLQKQVSVNSVNINKQKEFLLLEAKVMNNSERIDNLEQWQKTHTDYSKEQIEMLNKKLSTINVNLYEVNHRIEQMLDWWRRGRK